MVRRRSPFPVRSPRHAAAAPGALLLAVTIAALTGCSNPPPAGPASNRDAFWEPLSTTPVDSIATSDGRTRAVHLGIPYDTDAAGGARRLVEANLAEFGLTERHGLSPSSGHDLGGPDSPWGTVEVFRVDFQGVPVWGGEIRAIASDGMIRYLTVSVPRFVDLDITPALDPDAVLTRVRDEGLLVANDPLELVIFDRAFFADFHARDGAGGEPTLAYRVDAFDEGGEGYVEMFVSAVDGSVLYRSALGATARDRRIYNGAQRDQTCGVFPPDVRPMECGEP
ncbi:MAG: hypothetical protein AB8I08_12830, partial [Sandaracinaceae bacterium]